MKDIKHAHNYIRSALKREIRPTGLFSTSGGRSEDPSFTSRTKLGADFEIGGASGVGVIRGNEGDSTIMEGNELDSGGCDNDIEELSGV